jgi:uncharacterized protein (DUF427 family)
MNTQTDQIPQVAPVEGAIRNPSNPHHFMVIKPVGTRVRVISGDLLVADTARALYVIEISNKAYDPVVYVPHEDLTQTFEPLDKTSHCPLKGNASYFALNGEEIGWTYDDTLDFAEQLKGYYAFWPLQVCIEIGEQAVVEAV